MSSVSNRTGGTGTARYTPVRRGLDHGIGHLAFMSPRKNERLTPHRG
jgi:hypothetical protein